VGIGGCIIYCSAVVIFSIVSNPQHHNVGEKKFAKQNVIQTACARVYYSGWVRVFQWTLSWLLYTLLESALLVVVIFCVCSLERWLWSSAAG